jgi:hypothetical protein
MLTITKHDLFHMRTEFG